MSTIKNRFALVAFLAFIVGLCIILCRTPVERALANNRSLPLVESKLGAKPELPFPEPKKVLTREEIENGKW